jgi:hypothetical protein
MLNKLPKELMMDTTAVQQTTAGVQQATTAPPPPAPAPAPPVEQPFIANWRFPNGAGSAKLAVHADGAYLFSGEYTEHKPDHDFDIALALKVADDGQIIFHHVGEASKGVMWSSEGRSQILHDDFTKFVHKPKVWHGEYELPLSREGRAKAYEEAEKKKQALLKEEKEAEERHDQKVAAEKRAEREKQEQAERAAAQQAAAARQAAQSHSGGGGSDIWGTVGKVAAGIGTALLALL